MLVIIFEDLLTVFCFCFSIFSLLSSAGIFWGRFTSKLISLLFKYTVSIIAVHFALIEPFWNKSKILSLLQNWDEYPIYFCEPQITYLNCTYCIFAITSYLYKVLNGSYLIWKVYLYWQEYSIKQLFRILILQNIVHKKFFACKIVDNRSDIFRTFKVLFQKA